MKNIIFIAPPAAGKGTQSKLLVSNIGYEHISTGDILREEIALGSDLGVLAKSIIDDGNLVPDDIMIDIIKKKFDSIKGKPFILDGFPRTINQAYALSNILDDNFITVYMYLDKEVAKKRIVGRLSCLTCGKSYNEFDEKLMPKVNGICDVCGSSLVKRADDNEASFEVRYNSYIEKTEPIIDYYDKMGVLVKIDANNDRTNIYNSIIECINRQEVR